MSTPSAQTPPTQPTKVRSSAGRRARVTIVVFVATLLTVWFAVSVLPRWWSQRVGDQVGGDLTTGAILGFMYGFFAMLLPLALLALVYRFWRRSVKAWVVGGLIALLLASPNLITLGIAIGPGDSAHAADRTLDVEAPYFRGGMVIGAGVALVLFTYFAWATVSRRRSRDRAQRAERPDTRPTPPPPPNRTG